MDLGLKDRVYYRPKGEGYEATIRKLIEERKKVGRDRKTP